MTNRQLRVERAGPGVVGRARDNLVSERSQQEAKKWGARRFGGEENKQQVSAKSYRNWRETMLQQERSR